jgi:hypothetical protein
VPLEYSIGQLTCTIASRLVAVVVGWPGAVQDRLPASSPGIRPRCPGVPWDQSKDAELLVLRHENAVLRRHVGRIRYEPADRAWFAALASLLPRRRWTEIFPMTPATLLAGHRKLAASKYDTSKRRKPGRPPTVRSIAQRVPDDERAAPRATVTDVGTQQIRRKPILDGLINEYAHAA